MKHEEVIFRLKGIIHNELAPLITGDYVLWGLPYYPNIGDTLIWEGELEFLKSIPHKCIGTCSWDDYAIRPLKKDTVILITGGGYFGDVWRNAWDNVMNTIVHYPENPIVILPNTIFYESQETMKKDAARLSALKKLVICVRDNSSLTIAKNNFSNEVRLVPDMAFCIPSSRLERWMCKENGRTLFLKRNDKEIGSSEVPLCSDIDTRDWPTMDEKPKLADMIFGRAHRMRKEARQKGSRIAPAAALIEKVVAYLIYRPHLLRIGTRFLSNYHEIYTTRLHVMILGIILGKQVHYIDNSYGKLSSFYNTWLTECDNVNEFKL